MLFDPRQKWNLQNGAASQVVRSRPVPIESGGSQSRQNPPQERTTPMYMQLPHKEGPGDKGNWKKVAFAFTSLFSPRSPPLDLAKIQDHNWTWPAEGWQRQSEFDQRQIGYDPKLYWLLNILVTKKQGRSVQSRLCHSCASVMGTFASKGCNRVRTDRAGKQSSFNGRLLMLIGCSKPKLKM